MLIYFLRGRCVACLRTPMSMCSCPRARLYTRVSFRAACPGKVSRPTTSSSDTSSLARPREIRPLRSSARISLVWLCCVMPMLCSATAAEVGTYLRYCRTLDFFQKPDYNYLRQLFWDVFEANGYTDDGIYDWSPNGDAKAAAAAVPPSPASKGLAPQPVCP